ncbi:MAG: small multi-drug export protein [Lachnospiraceae bacterium]|nr:small multi-drug export protein [Lachnospiraceae bacterium]
MEAIATWFAQTLGQYVAPEWVVFIISMIPILELRGGLIAASVLQIDIWKAIPFCVVGNIIPIPFILLFIKKILQWMKGIKGLRVIANWLEDKANKKSDALKKGEFWGLALFVGIPLPGTGAWTGSLIAALFDVKLPKAVGAILLGIVIATIIMAIVSYGLLGSVMGIFN